MAEDPNADVVLSVGVVGTDSLVTTAAKLDAFLASAQKAVNNLNQFGDIKGITKLSSQLTQLVGLISKGPSDVQLLNALASGATKAGKAVDEQIIQKLLKVPQALGAAGRASENIDKLTAATEAYSRRINDNILLIERLSQAKERESGKAARSSEAQIRAVDKQLARDRELLNSTLKLAGAYREQQAAASASDRAYPQAVREDFARDSRGRRQQANLDRSIQVDQAKAEDRQRTQIQRDAQAAQLRQERLDRAILVEQAKAEDRVRTNQPSSRAASIVERGASNLGVQQVLGNDDAYIKQQIDLGIAQRKTQRKIAEGINAGDPEGAPKGRAGGASVFAFQAEIQAQYLLINSLFGAFREATSAVVQFDKELAQVGAVTNASNSELSLLRDTILDTSKAVPFTVKEIANAATELAKAGLSATEVSSSLKAVTETASATGITLKQSSEIFTTAFEVFKVGAGDSAKVADQLVTTLNRSRISSDSFVEAFQAVGVTAHESGLSLAETNAALASLADAGLHSGSLLGTGLRQVLIELADPPKKLADRFRELGISSDDLDVKLNTLPGVFENLKRAGFSTADVFETFSGRTAQAFAAALESGQSFNDHLTAELNSTGAASAANSLRISSLADRLIILGNTFESLAVKGTGPVLGALKELTTLTTGAVQSFSELGGGLSVVGTIMSGVVATGFLAWLNNLLKVGTIASTTMKGLAVAFSEVAAAESVAAGAGIAFAAASPVLIFGAAAAAVTLLIAGLGALGNSEGVLTAKSEALKEALSKTTDKVKEGSTKLEEINDFLATAALRSAKLEEDQTLLNQTIADARNKFSELSAGINESITSYEGLITAVVNLRNEQRISQGARIDSNIAALGNSAKDVRDRIASTRQSNTSEDFSYRLGAQLINNPDGGVIVGDLPSNLTSDPKLRSVLSLLQSGTTAPDFRQLQEAKFNVNNASGISDSQRNVLNDALNKLITLVGELSKDTGDLKDQTRQRAINQLQQSSGFKDAEASLLGSGRDASSLKNVINNPSLSAAQTGAGNLIDKLNGQVKQVEVFLGTLSAEDRQLVGSTDLGKQLDEVKGRIRTAQNELFLRVAKDTEKGATTALSSLSAQIDQGKGELRNTKDPAAAKALSERLISAERTKAEIERAKELAALDVESKKPDFNIDRLDQSKTEINSKIDAALQKGIQDIQKEANAAAIAALENQIKDIQSRIKTATSSKAGPLAKLASGDKAVEGYIAQYAAQYGVDVNVATRLVNAESGGNQIDPKTGKILTSDKGALGLTQLLPRTAQGLGVDPTNPESNVQGGIKYLAQLIEHYHGDYGLALAAYNFGPTNVDAIVAGKAGAKPIPASTAAYVDKIKGNSAPALFDQERQLSRQRDVLKGLPEDQIANNQDLIDQAQQRAGVVKDVNRPFNEKTPLDSVAIQAEIRRIDSETRVAKEAANQRVLALETYLSEARSLKNFPQAKLTATEEELQKARLKAAQLDADIVKTQGEQLQKQLLVAEDALRVNEQAKQAIFDKYNIGPKAVGTPNFTPGNEAQRTEVKLDLTKLDENGAAVDKVIAELKAKIAEANSQVEKFKTESKARDDASNPTDGGISAGFNDAVKTFGDKTGFGETVQKQTETTLVGTFSALDSSFSKFIGNFISGNNRGKASFKELGLSILQTAQQTITNKAVSSLLNYAFQGLQALAGSFTGGSTDFTAAPTGAANPTGQGLYGGGFAPDMRFAAGGVVPGVHVGRDSIPALLAPGEAVLNRSAVSMVGKDMITAMNNGAVQRGSQMPALPAPRPPDTTNVYVVDKNTQPTLGPRDVLATIHADVLSGGATKKLIKQVVAGQI